MSESHQIDVIGLEKVGLGEQELTAACSASLVATGVSDGHLSVSFVDSGKIKELNRRFRKVDAATDVLSFPVDGPGDVVGPRELGDIVVCPEHTDDLVEAIVHGALHLAGMDHEEDGGRMLELQEQILARL